jgi:hypothetical protein
MKRSNPEKNIKHPNIFAINQSIYSVIPATERQAYEVSAYREGKRESILYALQANEIGEAMQ